MGMKTHKYLFIISSLFAGLAVVVIAVWATQSYRNAQQQTTNGKITVVASTNVWGDIASQIGGEHINVTSILNDPSADPHTFETDARTISKVSSARYVITNGLGYDGFIDRLTNFSPTSHKDLIVSEIYAYYWGSNPHVWYSLPRIPEVAAAIRDDLIDLDPAHADDYRRNEQKFVAEMQPVISRLTKISAGAAYTERLPEYLMNDLGLGNKTPKGFAESVENGNEPSPQQLQEFQNILKSGPVKVLLYNNQTTNDVTEQLKKTAEQAGVKVVGLSETLPKGKNFQTWQMDQINAILEAL